MVAMEILQKQTKPPLLQLSANEEVKEDSLSFEAFLKNMSKGGFLNDESTINNDEKNDIIRLLQLFRDGKIENKTSILQENEDDKSVTTLLAGLLKNETTQISPTTLNPTISKKLTVTELKYLIHKAKQYIKQKIIQVRPDFAAKAKKDLPKTLKGLIELADKLKIEVKNISFETLHKQKPTHKEKNDDLEADIEMENFLNKQKDPKLTKNKPINQTQNKNTTQHHLKYDNQTTLKQTQNIYKEQAQKETTTKNTTDIQTKTTSPSIQKEKAAAENTTYTKKSDQYILQEIKTKTTQKEETIIKTIQTKIDTLKTVPLFQQLHKTTITKQSISTKNIIESKKHTKKEHNQNKLLESLLQNRQTADSTQQKELLFGKTIDLQKQNFTQSLEANADDNLNTDDNLQKQKRVDIKELLHGGDEKNLHHTQQIKTAESFDVKIHEAKQMMRYLSNDIKQAIEDYKPPFSRIKVKLSPQKLGELDMTVIQRGKNLHINLSSNNTAINLLANNLNDLKAQLNQNGINNASFVFNGSSQNDQNQKEREQARRKYEYIAKEDEEQENTQALEIIIPRYI